MMRPLLERPLITYCARCNEPFEDLEDMAQTGPDEYWHLRCFVCAQCFRPFGSDHEYYEFGGRKYCERDFKTLFAPCCSGCQQSIVGRFIRALGKCWHTNCFNCDHCQNPLADGGFVRTKNQTAICHACNLLDQSTILKKHTCRKCRTLVHEEDGELLRYKDEFYHAYHFNCHRCGIELNHEARQINKDLYCLKCHDQMGIPICGACRKPIEERVVTALGKHFHVNHFVCATCEKPFLGKRHYEVKGLAYCQEHYYQLFGQACCVCYQVVKGDIISALGRYYCLEHFGCFRCNKRLVPNKSEFVNIDSNPCCKKCYLKLPSDVRKRCAEQQKLERKASKKKNK